MKDIVAKLGLLAIAAVVLVPTFFGPLYVLVIHPDLPASKIGRLFAHLGADEHFWIRATLCLPPMLMGLVAAKAIAHLGFVHQARNE